MQVSNPNNIKIYNLSAGKSVPDWLSEGKRRALMKNDIDVRRRIDLIQDFDMPTVSNCVQVSRDGQYIFTSGVYKPRVRCYDVNQLSMKFERCFDSEVVKFHILSEDYTKLIFMQHDRHIEFHGQMGRYYRTRIPKFGRDFDYHYPSCDAYFVGASSEIYRLNLEQGRFLNSLKTDSVEINCCQFNPVHQLFACGTIEGKVECWDPRSRTKAGTLDCALANFAEMDQGVGVPSVKSLKFRDGLQMGVGTSTGQILMYDLRSDKPLLIKDHQYGLPIKSIAFHNAQDLVLSCDSRILKIWNRNTGKAFTSVEPPDTELNDLCLYPSSGMMFLANEAPKLQTYYIPALGPAPKWCSFLDSLTEELEENPAPSVYDDYKFVTRTELESLGLTNLIGSNLLRAYMHGYFMDIRLYHKAKSIAEPFAYEEYRRTKIREKIEQARTNRVTLKRKLPKVNKDLAQKLLDQEEEEETSTKKKGKKKVAANLLKDDRFSAMFKNPDFQVDTESEDYRLLNPVISKIEKDKKKKAEERERAARFDEVEDEELEGRPSDDDSSDDEHTWTQELKMQHKILSQEAKMRSRHQDYDNSQSTAAKAKPKFYELKEGQSLTSSKKPRLKHTKMSLSDRLKHSEDKGIVRQSGESRGNLEMTFTLKKNEKEKTKRLEAQQHHAERRKIRRSAGEISKKIKAPPKFYMGKRIN